MQVDLDVEQIKAIKRTWRLLDAGKQLKRKGVVLAIDGNLGQYETIVLAVMDAESKETA